MSPRLIILIVFAGGMAVYLAVRPPAPVNDSLPGVPSDGSTEIDETATIPVWKQDLPGEEPPEVPEFEIRVEVDRRGVKNRLYFYIDEIHGYYVEAPTIDFWYCATPDQAWEDSALQITKIVNDYIRENQTFKGCLEIVPAELARVGDDIGTDINWAAEVYKWGRVRAKDPERLPVVVHAMSCD